MDRIIRTGFRSRLSCQSCPAVVTTAPGQRKCGNTRSPARRMVRSTTRVACSPVRPVAPGRLRQPLRTPRSSGSPTLASRRGRWPRERAAAAPCRCRWLAARRLQAAHRHIGLEDRLHVRGADLDAPPQASRPAPSFDLPPRDPGWVLARRFQCRPVADQRNGPSRQARPWCQRTSHRRSGRPAHRPPDGATYEQRRTAGRVGNGSMPPSIEMTLPW